MHSTLLSALVVLALAASPAFADTVKLKNGDVLTGKIVSVLDGKVVLATDAAGEIKIDVAQVESLSTDAPITVSVPGGASFSGKAVMGAGGNITVEGAGVGAQSVALATAEINKPAKPPRAWTGHIVGAATFTRGNSYNNTASIDLDAVNRGEVDRISFLAFYRAGRQKDPATGVISTSERRVGGAIKYDYFYAEKAYWYANVSAEKNAVAAIDMRFVAGAGLGWQFIETDATKLSVEAGAAWYTENYSDDTTEDVDDMSARAAYYFDHKFNAVHEVFNDTVALKIFSDPKDYLIRTKGGFRQAFTPTFFSQEWIEFYWDTTPATGKKRNDVTYYLGIGWTF